MHWRTLLENYLAACALDDVVRLEAERHGHRYKFLTEHASTEFIHLEKRRHEKNHLKVSADAADPESFKLIEQTDTTIVVEVEPGDNQIPHTTSRFQFVAEDSNWLFNDYFWKCSCSDGNCRWCEGSGICVVCRGDGNCKFCDNQLTCQLCKGAKKCSICSDSIMPGWNSMKPKFKEDKEEVG